MTDSPALPRIVPVRGNYLELKPGRTDLISTNIYPVPPSLPFLGVHFTPTIDGRVLMGPNAVLAGAREGYRLCDVDLKEVLGLMSFSGMRKFVGRNFGFGLEEIFRELYLPAQVGYLNSLGLIGLISRTCSRSSNSNATSHR